MVSEVFWLLVLAIICLFAFFLVLGTFSIGDVGWVAVAVGVLVVAWAAHVILRSRHADERRRDPTLVHQRERRGF